MGRPANVSAAAETRHRFLHAVALTKGLCRGPQFASRILSCTRDSALGSGAQWFAPDGDDVVPTQHGTRALVFEATCLAVKHIAFYSAWLLIVCMVVRCAYTPALSPYLPCQIILTVLLLQG